MYDDCILDDLQVNNLRIIQRKGAFKFGSDAISLVNFVKIRPVGVALDIGSGTGIIPILLAGKLGFGTVYGVEIDEGMSKMSQQSVLLNNLYDSVHIINDRIQDIAQYMPAGSCNVVTSNPPFNKVGCGQVSNVDSMAQARFEYSLTLQDTLRAASYLLSTGGKLYMIHQIYRLAEIMHECIVAKLQPKIIQLVDSKRFMIQCTKDAKVGLIVQ